MASVAHILNSKTDQTLWTIDASASVYDAIAMMADKAIGALVVTGGGKIAGILTERDYARKVVLMDRSSRSTTVGEIMSETVYHVEPNCTTDACMAVMTEQRIRYIPVIDAGKPVGMVSIGDLVRNTIDEQKYTIAQLESYIHGSGPEASVGDEPQRGRALSGR
jgi:signal-transduction protein with cAMP-binding, CBS, and nucleotidyltransferase domain